jgi:hypothetical protein
MTAPVQTPPFSVRTLRYSLSNHCRRTRVEAGRKVVEPHKAPVQEDHFDTELRSRLTEAGTGCGHLVMVARRSWAGRTDHGLPVAAAGGCGCTDRMVVGLEEAREEAHTGDAARR